MTRGNHQRSKAATRPKRRVLVTGIAAAVAASGFAAGSADAKSHKPKSGSALAGTIYACYSDHTGALDYLKTGTTCPPGFTLVTWAQAGTSGHDGAAGPQGSRGADGSAGPQGPAGPQGATGSAGGAGPQGAIGPQGAAGPQGAPGSAASVGAQGPQGPQGAKGDTGATGATGAAGAAGAQGPQGAKGDTGAAGSAGPQGLTGPQGPQGTPGAVAGYTDANYTGGTLAQSVSQVVATVYPTQPGDYAVDGLALFVRGSSASLLNVACVAEVTSSGGGSASRTPFTADAGEAFATTLPVIGTVTAGPGDAIEDLCRASGKSVNYFDADLVATELSTLNGAAASSHNLRNRFKGERVKVAPLALRGRHSDHAR